MEKIFNMTIQRALAEAKRGNVQAMLQVADFYSRKMNREDDHYADNLSLALKWYEKAARRCLCIGNDQFRIRHLRRGFHTDWCI
jgi:hypothetical protein